MMSHFLSVTHILFDLDGLLLDTEGIYKECIEKVLEKYGQNYTDDVRLKVTGTKEQDTSRILVDELKLPTTSIEFSSELFEFYKGALGRAEIKPGAEKLIKHFHKKGIPMAVATSSGKETCAIKLKRYTDLCSCFSHVVMGSSDIEVVHGKPSPDIFIVAARRFPDSPTPDKCLVFEDSYNGVLAAKAAMMQVVMVPEDLVSEEKQKQATLVLRSLEDFKPEIFGLPGFHS